MLQSASYDEDIKDINVPQNIVWHTGSLADFKSAVLPLIDQSHKAGVRVIYIHFSSCEKMLDDKETDEIREITLSRRFEAFTVDVSNVINENGNGILYIFDSLSELQTAWATDMMMENFFTVITPMILQKSCKAFFPLIRGRHSLASIENIRSRTSAFLELYSDFKNLFLRPVWMGPENSGSINIPHVFDEPSGSFVPVTDGVTESHFRRAVDLELRKVRSSNRDSWDKFFDDVQRDFEDGRDVTEGCNRMRDIMMSRDEHIRHLLEKHFSPEDYFFVKEHMVGTGLIGGKSCGMLIARKIMENCCPDIYYRMEPHDSFFVGSDVFYTYIVENGFWDMRVKQRTSEGYFALADEFSELLLHGTFPEKIEKEFISLLDYYGNSPVIVRSSSILEDGFGNAFAGKYESVFCPGMGSARDRLEEFENAVRVVYASTLSRSALDYRMRRGLDNRDEQMALLVQRVSGSHYDKYYMPCAAGVGYSYSTYTFLDSLDPKAGMLRLVMGLGTGAVDRTNGSYPRLVSLDRPTAVPYKSKAEHHKYSQRNVDVLDRESGELLHLPYHAIDKYMPSHIKAAALTHDREAEQMLANMGKRRDVVYISCDGLVKNAEIMKDMRDLLGTLEEEYGQPVDIEFTINLAAGGEYVINLLQCRPLQHFVDSGRQLIPDDISDSCTILDISHCTLGLSQKTEIDWIVYVDPKKYYELPYNQKSEIAKLIGSINWYFRDKEQSMILLVPGRIGTSSPELGVPTAFSDISGFKAIFEIAESGSGYNPELSYGSHIFQDLVESEILYGAVFEDDRRRVFNPDLFRSLGNSLSEIVPQAEKFESIAGLYHVSGKGCTMYHDLLNEHLVCCFDEKRGTDND